ncbi:MAG TPA: response regulator [Verrucomicrobiae bacterium]|jgi:CheY-like chemotaxis protein|nr:response regulator [Verrucomicrobiae bacterium]
MTHWNTSDAETAKEGRVAGSSRRVLVVEDETLVAMMLEEMLQELNCSVLGPAGDLAEAMGFAEKGEFDLALLDVSLRRTPSFPVAEILQKRGIPFAFMTGYGVQDFPPAYQQLPRLSKPFDLPDLQRALKVLTG